MTDDELDRLQALADEATAGPWTAAATVDEYGQRLHTVDVLPLTTFGEIELNDAAFITASRDAVPALIAEVRRLRKDSLAALAFMQVATKHIGHYRDQVSAIRALANARLADTAHMASIQEAETLWAIVAATEGE